MSVDVIDNSWISYRHREDIQTAEWEAGLAKETANFYGHALQALSPGQTVTIGGDSVWINVPLEQDPVPIAIAAARLLRDGNNYRHDRPCDWNIKTIRQEYRQGDGGERVYAIGISGNTNPGSGYNEEPEALKKQVGL